MEMFLFFPSMRETRCLLHNYCHRPSTSKHRNLTIILLVLKQFYTYGMWRNLFARGELCLEVVIGSLFIRRRILFGLFPQNGRFFIPWKDATHYCVGEYLDTDEIFLQDFLVILKRFRNSQCDLSRQHEI